jgi:hypothetical protein
MAVLQSSAALAWRLRGELGQITSENKDRVFKCTYSWSVKGKTLKA